MTFMEQMTFIKSDDIFF